MKFPMPRVLAALLFLCGSLVAAAPQVSADAGEVAPAQRALGASISAGSYHVCFASGGSVYCWGSNEYGQLGLNLAEVTYMSTPTKVTGVTDVSAVAAGYRHTCALKSDGTVWCWGDGSQYATGGTGISFTPAQVTGVSAASALSAGGNHTCALVAGGAVKCWGANASGQLGNDSTSSSQSPVSVCSQDGCGSGALAEATAVVAGDSGTCAILSTARAACWGNNMMRQVGDGTTSDRKIPTLVLGQDGVGYLENVTSVGVGFYNACATTSAKAAFCWGANTNGQLGGHSNLSLTYAAPVKLVKASSQYTADAVGISVGEYNACLVRDTGVVGCFGQNDNGKNGNELSAGNANQGPENVSGVTDMKAVSLGRDSTCAASATSIMCWGGNSYGQLGNGTRTSSTTAVSVAGFLPQTVTFASLADDVIGTGTRTVSATSSGGGAVTFSSTTATVCTVSGTTVTYVAPGTCTVRASAASNGIFTAASSVDRSFAITGVKPTVKTAASTSVSGSRATLNAVVNPQGQTTTVNFVYGLKADLSDGVSQAANVATSMTDTDVSTTVTGLAERTKYYYRVEATNAQGTVKGDILSFTTARPVGVSVNDAAEFTNSRSVTVYVTGTTGSTQAILSNDGGFSNSKTFTLTDSSAEIPWTLVASKDERLPKVVYVKFVSRLGTASTPYQDDIILDTTAPSMSGASASTTASSPSNVTAAAAKGGVKMTVRASDKNSGIGKVQVKTSSQGRITDVPTSSPKASSRTVRINTTKKRLWVRVVDRAGNASKWVTVTVR